MNFNELKIKEIHEGLVKKEFSAKEIARKFLENIERKDKNICSFLTITENMAISQAEEVDQMIASKKEIPLLAGVPLAVKDNILVEGEKLTCASKILKNYIAPYSATCIEKLKEQKSVILGKTNLDEFAMGASTENSGFFPTKNPYDLKMVPGGSSGGSAAAVASGFCCFALGSDTGGSIRQPASFCGVVGLKPTYGAVSRRGLVAFASSLDQIGPIAKTAEDVAIVFEAISGKDELDSTSVEKNVLSLRDISRRETSFKFQVSSLRIGIPKEYFIEGIDKEVEKIIKNAIKNIEELGAKIKEISLPYTKYAVPVYYIVCTSEASSNLARYDGIKYGSKKGEKSENLFDVYLNTRAEGFGKEVKRRIMLGTYALSSGYYDAFYLKAQKIRTFIKQDFEKAFESVDAIFCPVSPHTAFKLGEKISDPLSMYLEDIFTVSANLAGLPAVSVPVGFSKGLPVGLQIIGNYFEENKILEIAKIYDKIKK